MAVILADGNFKCIFLNENDIIPIWISLKFVARSPIDNKPVLVQELLSWIRKYVGVSFRDGLLSDGNYVNFAMMLTLRH